MTDDATIRRRLRGLPQDEQRSTAVAMASVVLPLGELTAEAQPEGGLAAVADVVRRSDDHVAVDRARHLVWSMPEMAEDEEPETIAWFTFGASVAWLYAADAVLTAPADGVANCLSRVEDLLESVDEHLGDTHLHDDLLEALASDDVTGGLAALGLTVKRAVRRMAAQ